jgi:hypothetical protein
MVSAVVAINSRVLLMEEAPFLAGAEEQRGLHTGLRASIPTRVHCSRRAQSSKLVKGYACVKWPLLPLLKASFSEFLKGEVQLRRMNLLRIPVNESLDGRL